MKNFTMDRKVSWKRYPKSAINVNYTTLKRRHPGRNIVQVKNKMKEPFFFALSLLLSLFFLFLSVFLSYITD